MDGPSLLRRSQRTHHDGAALGGPRLGEGHRPTRGREIPGVVVVFANHRNAMQWSHRCRVALVFVVLMPGHVYGRRMDGQQRVEAWPLLIIARNTLSETLREFRT